MSAEIIPFPKASYSDPRTDYRNAHNQLRADLKAAGRTRAEISQASKELLAKYDRQKLLSRTHGRTDGQTRGRTDGRATYYSALSESSLKSVAKGENAKRGTAMPNLTGRPVQPKTVEAAEREAMRSRRRSEAGKQVKERIVPKPTVDKQVIIDKLEAMAKARNVDEDWAETWIQGKLEFNDKVWARGDVEKWFLQELEKRAPAEPEPSAIDVRQLRNELCGSADEVRQESAMDQVGMRRNINEAGISADKVINAYGKLRDKFDWSGMKAIGHALGTCLFLHHIVGIDGDKLEVMSLSHGIGEPVPATQRDADLVAKAISAITGRVYRGVPSEPKGYSQRRIK